MKAGVSSGARYTISDLEPGTGYTIGAYVFTNSWGSNFFYDDNPVYTNLGKLSASIEEVTTTMTSLKVALTDIDSSYWGRSVELRWSIGGSQDGSTDYITLSRNTYSGHTFTGLSPGTRYTIQAYVRDEDTNTETWISVKLYTNSADAYVSVVKTNFTAIDVRLKGLTTEYTSVKWYINNNYSGTQTLSNTGNGPVYTFKSGLKPGYTYTIKARIYIGSTYVEKTATATTLSIGVWSWSASNGTWTNGNATYTKNAKTAVDNQGAISNFSYLVWNDLVDKVAEVLSMTDDTWSSNYANQSATRMSSSDKVLTAKRFNSLRFNIGRKQSTGLDEVSTGDPVYGWYFTRLTDRLNTYINSL